MHIHARPGNISPINFGSFGEVNVCGLSKEEQVKCGRLSFCSLAVFIACNKSCLRCFLVGFGGGGLLFIKRV